MKNWSLTTMTTIAICVTVLLLVHIGTISLNQCFRRLEDTKLSQQRLQVLTVLDGIRFDLSAAVAGEQSYVFSGLPRHREQYEKNIKKADQRLRDLDMALNGRHRMLSDEIKSYIRVRRECADEVIGLFEKSGTEAALARSSEMGEDRVTSHIEGMVDDLANQADAEFRARAHEMDRGSMQTVAGITLLMSVALIILLVIIAVVHKYVNERQRAESSLRIAERRFRAVFNQTFQFSGLLSPQGNVLEVNHTALEFANLAPEKVKESLFWETPWWNYSEKVQNKLKDAVGRAEKGEMVRLETEVMGTAGPATVDMSVKPVKNDDGQVIYLLAEARDITERKKAEQAIAEREARMRAIVETAPDGIVTVNADGTIESVNSAMERLFGYEASELIGKDVNVILPGLLSGGVGESDEPNPIRTGERRVFGIGREFYGTRKDGSLMPVEVSLSVIRLEDHQILTGIVRDVTERKEAENRVREFYSTVSHELRTPLTAIRTALGLMESTVLEQVSHAKPVLDIACEEADRLIRLINDILDIRKIEAGKMDLQLKRLHANDIVRRAVDSIESLARDAGIDIETELEDGAILLADEDRLQQVLSNLLSNAIKFSPEKSSVLVKVFEDRGKCRFEIRDDGPGIPDDEVEKLFGRFEQVSVRDGRSKGGTGLGLAIAKAIVEQHGGQIGVGKSDEQSKSGSIFWFELPLASQEPAVA
ncbi:MAG: PAS domain S-box protein [Cyanobacteria bacterium HKST-UBA02]|nr:PAS domain S-box protein [Cyanobacteria bacterium HKST-UBA02]